MRFSFLPPMQRERDVENADAGVPLRPPLPIAKRLNRNALTLAAVVMGMTVLTVLVVLNPTKGSTLDRAPAPIATDGSVVPARPAFLDEPVRAVPAPPNLASDSAHSAARPDTVSASSSVPPVGALASPPALGPPVDDATGGAAGATMSPVEEHESLLSARARAFRAALSSPVTVRATGNGRDSASSQPTSELESEEQQLVTLGDSVLRSTMRPPLAIAPKETASASDAEVPTAFGAGRPSVAHRQTSIATSHTTLEVIPAGSPSTLRAGTVIPGLLITGITSELPGDIMGQVSRDVYDSRTQRLLLIPKGARLLGSYENQIAAGQGRLLVAWTRLILPDGRSVRLPGLALTDRAGQAGAKDRVDNHWWRVFGNAVLLSAIGAGAQLSQPAQTTVLSTPSAGQVAAGAVGQELSNVALEILRKGMNIAPTITIRAGQPFNVFLNSDLTFEEPYTPRG